MNTEKSKNTWVDLGLPSGTLWKPHNEKGYYIYNEIISKFGNTLPTKEQFEELKNECTWEWQGDGYKVTGPNGNSIILPAAGIRYGSGGFGHVSSEGRYWSSTSNGSKSAWGLYFGSNDVGINGYGYRYGGRSIRLVKNNNSNLNQQ